MISYRLSILGFGLLTFALLYVLLSRNNDVHETMTTFDSIGPFNGIVRSTEVGRDDALLFPLFPESHAPFLFETFQGFVLCFCQTIAVHSLSNHIQASC